MSLVPHARPLAVLAAATMVAAAPRSAAAQEVRTIRLDNVCSSGPTVACASVHVTTRNGVAMHTDDFDGIGTELLVRMRNEQGWRASPDDMIWSRLRDFRMYGDGDFGPFVGFGTSLGGWPTTEGNVPSWDAAAFSATAVPWDGGPLFGETNGGGMTGIIDLWDFFQGVGGAAYHSDVIGCARSPSVGSYTAALQTCVRDAADVAEGIATAENDPWVTFGWRLGSQFNVDDPGMRFEWNILGVPGASGLLGPFGAALASVADGPIPGVKVSFSAFREEPGVDDFGVAAVPAGFTLVTAAYFEPNANGFNAPPSVAAVPEPGPVGLVGGGLLLLGVAARRRGATND